MFGAIKFNIKKSQFWGIFTSFILTLILFRDLVENLSSHLFDWHDYPLVIWILYQNIEHMLQLNFSNFFESNIFYGFPQSLLFSELFLPQSLLALPLTFFFKNPIFVFNIVFFFTFLLNSIGAYYLWSACSKNGWIQFFASLSTVFSVFIFHHWYHFHMLSLWPLLFSLGFILRIKRIKEISFKYGLILGGLISLTFYSSVYLWVFLITILSTWALIAFLFSKHKLKAVNQLLLLGGVSLLVFTLFSGFTVFNYIETQRMYQAQREYGEYVLYSSHLSDYVFPRHDQSLVWGTELVKKWSSFNQHHGIFPGVTVILLAVYGLFSIGVKNKNASVEIPFTTSRLLFLSIMIMGVLFSLGPRLSVNGQFTGIPLPYHLLLRTVPLFEVARVTSRWSLLFFLGLSFFALEGLRKLPQKHLKLLVLAFSLLFLSEVYPFIHPTRAFDYQPQVYQVVKKHCTPQSVLMEYPLTQDIDEANISTNLTYRTTMMLASLNHDCQLINGYSGYIPPEYNQYESELIQAVYHNEIDEFLQLVTEKNVDLIKLNKDHLRPPGIVTINAWIDQRQQLQLLYNDTKYALVRYTHE